MKEKLLVLAKAVPEISRKYEHLVCVAGITDKGEWRRIYPIPWSVFWGNSGKNFKKKFWIEYEVIDTSSDYRPESRRINPGSIKLISEAKFEDIEKLLKVKLTTLEDLEKLGPKNQSLGVIAPIKILDFTPMDNKHYEELVKKSKQLDFSGNPVVKLDIPKYKYRYKFTDKIDEEKPHETLCEDWEVGMLYKNCEDYRKEGRYQDEQEVHDKVKEKMLNGITKNGHVYFIVGSHFRFPTYMVVGVIYPKKDDILT